MRFKLTLSSSGAQCIPINYQYPLSAWIYKVFDQADPDFANWLHEFGYTFNGNRRYKLFTFSNIITPNVRVERDRLHVASLENHFYISFRMEDAGANFIKGLFLNRELTIADRHSKGKFLINSVERLPDPDFGTTDGLVRARFRCLSPIIISNGGSIKNNKQYAQYLAPDDEDYKGLFFENLVRRYATARQKIVAMEASSEGEEALVDLPFQTQDMQLDVLSKPHSRLQTIKAFTPAETKVRGYLYRFRLTAPAELLEFGWHAGFGEKGSLGFGCGEVMV